MEECYGQSSLVVAVKHPLVELLLRRRMEAFGGEERQNLKDFWFNGQ